MTAGWYGFFTSAGFGGVSAVIAASIAFAAARYGARIDRRLGEREAWWERAQWALDLTRDSDCYAQLLGWNTLTTLVESASTNEDAKILKNASIAAQDVYEEEASGGAEPEEDSDDEPTT